MVLTEPLAKKNSEIPVVSFLLHAMFNLSEKNNFHSRQTDMLKVQINFVIISSFKTFSK